jgi:aminopeptidase N
MKKLSLLLFFACFQAILFGQIKENHNQCFKKNAFVNSQLKSNTLSVAQIAETEKYDVHYYALNLTMNNLSTNVAGTVEIHAKTKEAIDSALFELFSTMTISQIRVDGIPTTFTRVASAVYVPVNLSVNQSFIIAIDYNGTPPTAATNPLGGSGMSNATSPSWGNQVTWSLSQPFSAYEWWPCKQSLSDKADSCEVKVTVPSNCKAGSNGVLENVVDLGNGNTRYEWKHRHPIDYYLISVSVAQYIEYNVYANPTGAVNPILIQNFIYNNPATLTNFQAEIDETADFLELFSELFGPYPFEDEKYGHCMAPFSGGMEHQTMTTQGFFEKSLTAHELGHQWWGDHVTCASWADIWVNEGFASYSDFLMIENLYPAEKVQYMQDVHTNIMSQPNGSVYVLDSLNESRIFSGRLSYDKGSAIIHTMRFVMNNDNLFFQALRNYQNQFKDSVAKGLDVKAVLEQTSGIDYDNVFNEWYFGEGYPTYSSRWNKIGNDLILEITHTASAAVVTPTFTNPLEIKFTRTGMSDTIIRFDINANTCQYYVPNVGPVSSISQIDPNNWIINKSGAKIYDPNFFLGLTNDNESSRISIFPNPTNNLIQVFDPFNENSKLIIFDQEGKLLINQNFKETLTVSLENFDAGIYSFVIYQENRPIHVEKVIKH